MSGHPARAREGINALRGMTGGWLGGRKIETWKNFSTGNFRATSPTGAGRGRAEETLGWLIRRGSVRREERIQGNMETWSQVWSVSPVLGVGEREIWSDR